MHEPMPPGIPRDPVVRAPRRRQSEPMAFPAFNGTLRFRVFAPTPRKALRIVGIVEPVIGPFLVNVLGGRVKLPAAAKCTVCGHHAPEPINGDRWLCPPSKPEGLTPEQRAKHEAQGPRVWAREWLLDERGKPQHLTMALALQDAQWMGMVAQAIHDRLSAMALGGDQIDDLVCGLLVDACEVQPPGMPDSWFPIRDAEQLDLQLDQCMGDDGCSDGASVLLRLAAAALKTWVFPMLRGGLTGTPRVTTETEIAGGSSPSPRTGTDDPSPATGRALPRSARRRG